MCLGVPGKILSLEPNAIGMMMGKVSFGGVAKEVCLAYVPEAQVGEYVIVHAGFALNTLNEHEANEVFELLRQMGEIRRRDLMTNDEDMMAFVVRPSSFNKGNPMRFVDEYRDEAAAHKLLAAIVSRQRGRGGSWKYAAGRRTVIKSGIDGCCRRSDAGPWPGCPVCVTPLELIDKAIAIARRRR